MDLCERCKETTMLAEIKYFLNKEKDIFVRARYDFDDVQRNEIDFELGYYLYDDNNNEKESNAEWSFPFNTNYCMWCGRKLNNQEEITLDDLEYVENRRNFFILVNHEYKDSTATLYLDLNNKRLQLDLLYKGQLMSTKYLYIKYSPIDGRKL